MTRIPIEPETADIVGAIRAVHLNAFPSPVEADLVDRLRADGDIEIGLAARSADAIVGHIVFSPMTAPVKALGLGPIAALPQYQRQGIGSLLIEEGINRAREGGWEAVFVLGEPKFYTRFGFSAAAASGFTSPYAGPYFMALSLRGGALKIGTGRIDYAPAFRALE